MSHINTFSASCFRDVMSAGWTVFAYTCLQCVVEIKRTKQYFLISKTLQTSMLARAEHGSIIHKAQRRRFYVPAEAFELIPAPN